MQAKHVRSTFFCLLLLWIGLASPLFGQSSSATLSGKVEDQSGAALPGAAVTVRNMETNEIRNVVADNSGRYLAVSLPVGKYEVKVTAQGFKTKIETNVALAVGQEATLNVALDLGSVDESVTVTGDPSVVNLGTASVSGLVGEKEVKDLPLNGRSFDNLITLNTGAINYTSFSGTSASGGGTGNAFHVDGRRATENLFLLNGIEYTGESNRSNQPGGVSGQLLGVDAIREFNVLTDTYSAEYGKRPGAQINVVTQSGGNQMHGTVFEFLRNSALDARNYFDASPAQIGRRIPEFQRNQFGAALGGPIIKDKAFVFGNYEGFRQNLGVSDVAYVPDNNARQGLLPYCTINTADPSCKTSTPNVTPTPVPNANPNMYPLFAFWPVANGPSLGAGIATYTGSPKETIKEDFGTLRLDQNLTAKDIFTEAYTIDNGTSFIPQNDPTFYSDYYIRNQVLSVEEDHTFSARMLNTARVGYSRATFNFNVPPVVSYPANFSFFQGLEPGQLSIGGGLTTINGTTSVAKVGGTSDYLYGTRNLFTYSDDLQIVRGKHHLSFGGWFQRMQDNRSGANRKAGQVSFGSLQTFIQGIESDVQGTPNPTYSGYRLWMAAWYAQDNWNVTPRLVLNLGLRHELNSIMKEAHGHIGNDLLDANGVMSSTVYTGQLFPTNRALRNFGPRVGLAWDVFGNGNTAVRSGFGLYYSLLDYQLWIVDGIAPFNTTVDYGANQQFLSMIPEPVGTSATLCGPGVPQPCQTIAQKGFLDNRNPSVAEWNLSIEQKIGTRASARISYVGSHGYHEPISVDYNSIHPQICSNTAGCAAGGLNKFSVTVPLGTQYIPYGVTRPNPYLTSSTETIGSNSSYNALQAEIREHLSRGLLFRVNYTFAKDLDVADEIGGTESANSPPQTMEPYNPRADWGASSNDVRHDFSVSGTYELPFGKGRQWLGGAHGATEKLVGGWQLNTIATLLSGFPFNPLVGTGVSGNGNSTNPDRPALNPAFTGPIVTHNPNQWFNPQAFVVPTPGTFSPVRKGTLRGPGLAEWDLALLKETGITERLRAQFRFEAFNVLNHTNFSFPTQTVFAGSLSNNPSSNYGLSYSPTVGRIIATATSSRQLQAAIKLIF